MRRDADPNGWWARVRCEGNHPCATNPLCAAVLWAHGPDPGLSSMDRGFPLPPGIAWQCIGSEDRVHTAATVSPPPSLCVV